MGKKRSNTDDLNHSAGGISTEAESKKTPNSNVAKSIQIVQSDKIIIPFAKDEVDIPDLLKKNKLNYRQNKRVRDHVDN